MLRNLFLTVLIYVIGWSCLGAMPAREAQGNYRLEKVLVLSRHNIRSPLSTNGSALARMTPHAWFNWTSGPSELSLRGGELETLMGQYFRKWLVSEGFMSENEVPEKGQMRFYANSMQRTIATARYFSTGMLPLADVRIEHRFAADKMDPVFCPCLGFFSNSFERLAISQISEMGGARGLQGINEKMAGEFNLVEELLDYKNSQLAQETDTPYLRLDDLKIVLKKNEEPNMKGSFKTATQASDAFILQYYEESDPMRAAFGEVLNEEEWTAVARIKDMYGDVLFTAPAVAVNVAHPLLKEMQKEMDNKHRKFTFLCGHDSNLSSVLAALEVAPYELPNSIEKKTPIGSKFVISKWVGKDGGEYASLDLIYQTVQQLREREMLSLDNPPAVFGLELEGLTANEDGLYKWADVRQRFGEAVAAYKELPKD